MHTADTKKKGDMPVKDKLPIGIENFEEIRTEGFYYVDKTCFIRDLLNHWGKVNLFSRPRRFGKSLNMSMLKYFFGYGCDSKLFEGLEIAKETELCQQYMGKFPVISISLKDAGAGNYETARGLLCSVIRNEAMRFSFLKESGQLVEDEKIQYQRLLFWEGQEKMNFSMNDETLTGSLFMLCRLLYRHFGQKVILLIDEYDVPLDKAQQFGYYDEMIHLISNLFSQALKSNDFLQFAVLTGCLKIAKESVFTGLNNIKIFSIVNIRFEDYFGFSDSEVKEMLSYYDLKDKFDIVKEWYNGYRFGMSDVYCPWDVINYVDLLLSEPDAPPKTFWLNTSDNDIIRNFIKMAKPGTKRELEQLIKGESVAKKINLELTYRDLYSNIDNLWSVLFMTGYLTQGGTADERKQLPGDTFLLTIPNQEIRKIFVDQIMEWFQTQSRKDTSKLDAFCRAFFEGNAEAVETQFNAYLAKTISIRDTSVRKNKKENFYHGILLGLLGYREDWYMRSNAESGNGFSDILIEIDEDETGIVIEVKYQDNGDLDKGCLEALDQIDRMDYDAQLRQDGMERILKYGISCNRKKCKVMMRS